MKEKNKRRCPLWIADALEAVGVPAPWAWTIAISIRVVIVGYAILILYHGGALAPIINAWPF